MHTFGVAQGVHDNVWWLDEGRMQMETQGQTLHGLTRLLW